MFARTERLLLRPGWREDAPALHKAIADECIVRNLARAPWPYAMVDAEAFLARDPAPDAPQCLIFLRTGGAPQLVRKRADSGNSAINTRDASKVAAPARM